MYLYCLENIFYRPLLILQQIDRFSVRLFFSLSIINSYRWSHSCELLWGDYSKKETHTPNDEYENFVNANIEAAAECIPTKQRAKPRVPWETLAVRKKRADVKTASKCNRKNPTNTNVLKLKKAQNEFANIYLKKTNRIHTKSNR